MQKLSDAFDNIVSVIVFSLKSVQPLLKLLSTQETNFFFRKRIQLIPMIISVKQRQFFIFKINKLKCFDIFYIISVMLHAYKKS